MTTAYLSDMTEHHLLSFEETTKDEYHDDRCNKSADDDMKNFDILNITTNISSDKTLTHSNLDTNASPVYSSVPLFGIVAILGAGLLGALILLYCMRKRKKRNWNDSDKAFKRFHKKHISRYKSNLPKENKEDIKIMVSRPSMQEEEIEKISFIEGSGDYENVKTPTQLCLYKVMETSDTLNCTKDTPSLDGSVFLYVTPVTNHRMNRQSRGSSISSAGMFLTIPKSSAEIHIRSSYLSLHPMMDLETRRKKSSERTISVGTVNATIEEYV